MVWLAARIVLIYLPDSPMYAFGHFLVDPGSWGRHAKPTKDFACTTIKTVELTG
jgi:hypothetical protein